MSTFAAVAPPLSLFGPRPRPPVYGLLPQLERLGLIVPGESHWESGANIWMYPCVTASPNDPCGAGTYASKDDGDGDGAGEQINTLAFTAYAPLMCSTISIGDYEEFYGRLETSFLAVESAAVERELSDGRAIDLLANAHFGDGNVTTPAGTSAVTPEVGLRWLERAIGLSQRQGIIHAPPEVAAAWRYDELDVRDGVLQTLANGTPVIAGPGYQGSHPDSQGAPASGTAWAYATGNVAVRRGELVRFSEVESIDRSDNTVVIRAERDYLASFDPCVQAAVLIDWTP